jgi:hypothetical protein
MQISSSFCTCVAACSLPVRFGDLVCSNWAAKICRRLDDAALTNVSRSAGEPRSAGRAFLSPFETRAWRASSSLSAGTRMGSSWAPPKPRCTRDALCLRQGWESHAAVPGQTKRGDREQMGLHCLHWVCYGPATVSGGSITHLGPVGDR